ncbi:hypothetical protein OESDEN_09170 [Oesophagostomum dentatum]|uniref:Uncharacterized protein n=1 Tax=Oesophagostomum dentatum TaxID=61180 RepID=A0A0B1T489_OESDE|nr:hypothetical protein OESDEN_09170 [Oesophagostomum dentatum]
MEFCLEDNHFSDEMSEASAVSYYSSSEAEEPLNVGFAHEIYNEEEDNLKTAISGVHSISSAESLLSDIKRTASK